ncbi:MAG TPA: hypothetical protein VLL52_19165 [Anaerolineae bacterium]|nr:hypothetical protein [Anaerolineae bacterium]
MNKKKNQQRYEAYLLRLWRSSAEQVRIKVQNVHTDEEQSFANWEDLVAFLENNRSS